ncbi:MAG: hypothetical protein IPI34_04705 [bacterium]|nr:hypothetical protein [bacterium]
MRRLLLLAEHDGFHHRSLHLFQVAHHAPQFAVAGLEGIEPSGPVGCLDLRLPGDPVAVAQSGIGRRFGRRALAVVGFRFSQADKPEQVVGLHIYSPAGSVLLHQAEPPKAGPSAARGLACRRLPPNANVAERDYRVDVAVHPATDPKNP